MAKVKNPLNSIQASGTVGGVTYVRNQYGAYSRTYVSPVQPNTAEQLTYRGIMQTLNTAWKNTAVITHDHYLLWLAFSQNFPVTNKFGEQKRLDPLRWFIKMNYYRQRAGLSIQTMPPLQPTCSYIPVIDFYWDTGGIYVEIWPRPTGNQFVLVHKIAAQPHTRNFPPNQTTFGAIANSASTYPLKIWDSADIDTNPHNWFFRVTVCDEYGAPSAHQWFKVFTVGTPSTAVFSMLTSNILRSSSPTQVIVNTSWFAIKHYGSGLQERSLLRFGTTGLSVTSVRKAYLYVRSKLFTNYGLCNVYAGITQYDRLFACWNNYDDGVPWTVPGGESGVDYVSDPLITDLDVTDTVSVFRLDVTNAMQYFLPSGLESRFWFIASVVPTDQTFNSDFGALFVNRPTLLLIY